MIWIIAKREFLEYLKSLRFMIGFLITITLVVLGTFINANDFTRRNQEYVAAREELQGNIYRVVVHRPPEVLSTLVQGMDRKLGSQAELSPMSIPARTSGYMGSSTSQHQRLASGFSTVDYAFVVRMILSLVAIFLGFDAVAGEKSRGTLRLVLSNAVPRHAVLVGKSIGGLVFLCAILALATLSTLLVLILNPGVALGEAEWVSIMAMTAVSGVYMTFFFTLTIAVTVIVERPPVALLLLLQAWVVLVILYPVAAVLVAENLRVMPDDRMIQERRRAALQPYERESRETEEAFSAAFRKHVEDGVPMPTDLELKNLEVHTKMAMLNHQLDIEFDNLLSDQMRTARTVAILSPAALYDRAMTRLARTGTDEYERFMATVTRYWEDDVALSRRRIVNPMEEAKLPAMIFLREPAVTGVAAAIPPALLLFAMSSILFAVAYVRFSTKDVR